MNQDKRLTPQELKVSELLADDLSEKQVAASLGITRKTVNKHAENIHRKLGVHTNIGVVLWFQKKSLLGAEPENHARECRTAKKIVVDFMALQ